MSFIDIGKPISDIRFIISSHSSFLRMPVFAENFEEDLQTKTSNMYMDSPSTDKKSKSLS